MIEYGLLLMGVFVWFLIGLGTTECVSHLYFHEKPPWDIALSGTLIGPIALFMVAWFFIKIWCDDYLKPALKRKGGVKNYDR